MLRIHGYKNALKLLTATGRDEYTAKTFYYGVFDAYRLKLTWVMYFKCPKNSIRGLKISFSFNFRFICGEISAKNFFFKFLLYQRIRIWISEGVSSAIFELSCSFPLLWALRILAVYCQLVLLLVINTIQWTFCSRIWEPSPSYAKIGRILPVPLSPIWMDLSTYHFRQQLATEICQNFPSIFDNKLHMLWKLQWIHDVFKFLRIR